MRLEMTALACALAVAGCGRGIPKVVPTEKRVLPLVGTVAGQDETTVIGHTESVARLDGPTPTGVAVSRTGRTFLSFPRWDDPVRFTVGELTADGMKAYPDQDTNEGEPSDAEGKFVSAQSVVIDPADRLWVVDTGSVKFGTVGKNAAKLVGIDLATNKIFKTITFPPDVVLSTSYLNDVRFDLRRGKEGTAFITDSSDKGPNAIVVVDLESGRSMRRLGDHPSVKADPTFTPVVEGKEVLVKPKEGGEGHLSIGADGIALSADGSTLYYTPLASRRLSTVSAAALADPLVTDEGVAATVLDVGNRTFASDGLEADSAGNIYFTDYEHNAVHRLVGGGVFETILRHPDLVWPDSLSMAADGFLYVTASQLNRQPKFHRGDDERKKPFLVLRTRTGTGPVTLR